RLELVLRSDGPGGPLADDDRSRLRRLLEPRGDVDRVPRHQELVLGGPARGDDVAGVHAYPQLEALGRRAILIPDPEAVEHPLRCTHGPYGVVLVSSRDAEDRHDG